MSFVMSKFVLQEIRYPGLMCSWTSLLRLYVLWVSCLRKQSFLIFLGEYEGSKSLKSPVTFHCVEFSFKSANVSDIITPPLLWPENRYFCFFRKDAYDILRKTLLSILPVFGRSKNPLSLLWGHIFFFLILFVTEFSLKVFLWIKIQIA